MVAKRIGRLSKVIPLSMLMAGLVLSGCSAKDGTANESSPTTENSGSTGVTLPGVSGLVRAQFSDCAQGGQNLAAYLSTGLPTSNDPTYGNLRQEALSLSGEKQALYIRQQADAYIQQCDQDEAQAQADAAQEAAQQAALAAQQAAQAKAAYAEAAATRAGRPNCNAVGGTLSVARGAASMTCISISYIGSDGQDYFGASAPMDPATGNFTSALNTAGTGATQQECTSGYYPDLSTGPGTAAPGNWNTSVRGCLPSS